MLKVNFTSALKRFFPDLKACELQATDLNDLINQLDQKHSGLRGYVLEDNGQLRKHVNIFIDGNIIVDRVSLSDELSERSDIYIMQALSGG